MKKGSEKYLEKMIEPFLTELALDNSHLNKIYFQKHIPFSDVLPEELGVECLICLTEVSS